MKKILFTLLIIIFFIPSVNAEETCTNLLDVENANWYSYRGSFPGPNYSLFYSLDGANISYLPSKNTTYTFYLNDGSLSFNDLLSTYGVSLIYLRPNSTYYTVDLDKNSYTFTWIYGTTSTDLGVQFSSSTKLTSLKEALESNEITAWLVEGDSVCVPAVDEEPDEPVVVADATLDTFYSIYLEKLQSLSNYAVENKFILSIFAIIILFIILEIILNLFRRGGYR